MQAGRLHYGPGGGSKLPEAGNSFPLLPPRSAPGSGPPPADEKVFTHGTNETCGWRAMMEGRGKAGGWARRPSAQPGCKPAPGPAPLNYPGLRIPRVVGIPVVPVPEHLVDVVVVHPPGGASLRFERPDVEGV